MIVTPRPPMSAVQLSSGTGQISAASSSASVAGGSSRPPGARAAMRRASRAMCAVSAVTSGAVWPSSAPSRYTVPRSRSSVATSNGVPPVAAAHAAGLVSHPSAGMIVAVIDVRVRSLVVRNCSAAST